MESPGSGGSPLSSIDSSEFEDDVTMPDEEPPRKRARKEYEEPEPQEAPEDEYISDDSYGEVPLSPAFGPGPYPQAGGSMLLQNEDFIADEQVTECKWEGCTRGDLKDLDALVRHVSEDHIGGKKTKYSCEWGDCSRKGQTHASGYALRAHMRSHTKEKPFYCALPECDRSFTRSDALAKHMRTVHETEQLRPSDPVPKHHSSQPVNRNQRLKINVKSKSGTQSPAPKHVTPEEPTPENDPSDPLTNGGPYPYYDALPSSEFTPEEEALPPLQLHRLLRRQIKWAEEESAQLKAELEHLTEARKQEWLAKEMLLENLMEAEVARREQRNAIKRVRGDKVDFDDEPAMERELTRRMTEDVFLSRGLSIVGPKIPWFRDDGKVQRLADYDEQRREGELERERQRDREREREEMEYARERAAPAVQRPISGLDAILQAAEQVEAQ